MTRTAYKVEGAVVDRVPDPIRQWAVGAIEARGAQQTPMIDGLEVFAGAGNVAKAFRNIGMVC